MSIIELFFNPVKSLVQKGMRVIHKCGITIFQRKERSHILARSEIEASGSGETRTYAYLRACAKFAYRQLSEKGNEGSSFYILQTMTFCAFAMEAYLNHLGAKRLNHWSTIGRKLGPEDKLDLLLELNKGSVDKSRRPFQTFSSMVTFRNLIVHGQTETITKPSVMTKIDGSVDVTFPTKWQSMLTKFNAKRYLDDLDELFVKIAEQAGVDYEHPAILGTSGYTTNEPSD